MPMRKHLTILLLATLAQAIPLRKGETWTWQVTNPPKWGDTSGARIASIQARIIDSEALTPSLSAWRVSKATGGTLWRIEAWNPSTGAKDTGRILASPDGTQTWDRYSHLLLWEPVPRQQLAPSANLAVALFDFTAPYSSDSISWSYPWGGAMIWSASGYAAGLLELGCDSTGISYKRFGAYFNTIRTSTPQGLWSLDGVEHFQVADQEWRMTSHNGVARAITDSLNLPATGSSMTWQQTDASTCISTHCYPSTAPVPFEISDSILSRPADSSGWVRLEIRETTMRGSVDFSCRIAPDRASSKGCPGYASLWIRSWKDSSTATHFIRKEFWTRGGYTQEDRHSLFARIRKDGILDSLVEINGSTEATISVGTHNSSTSRILLAVNGEIIRSPSSSSIHSCSRTTADLQIKLRTYPECPITWHDLAGRTGTLRAGDLLKPSATPRLLILDATFPDDSRWQGKYLTGTQH